MVPAPSGDTGRGAGQGRGSEAQDSRGKDTVLGGMKPENKGKGLQGWGATGSEDMTCRELGSPAVRGHGERG